LQEPDNMLVTMIRRWAWPFAGASAASVLAGLCSVALVATINAVLAAPAAERQQWLLRFVAAVVLACAGRLVSGVLFQRLSQYVMADLRTMISGRVLDAPYRQIESAGWARIQSALTEDSLHVAAFLTSLPVIVTNLVIVCGCLAYLAWLSLPIFAVAVVIVLIGSAGYRLAHARAVGDLRRASQEQVRLQSHFESLVAGAKELRLHRQRREVFRNQLLGASLRLIRDLRARGLGLLRISAVWGVFLIFTLIGLVLFAFADGASREASVAIGFTVVLLYLATPLEVLLNNLPALNLARVAAQRIENVVAGLTLEPRLAQASTATPGALHSIELQGVTYRYGAADGGVDREFEIGPIDLRLHAGELVFLVGGNGSGKTSLAKLLTGLYEPGQGVLRWNGAEVGAAQRDDYRQLFSTVFSDFHLFESLIGEQARDLDIRGNALLERLQLRSKVQVRDGAFSTRALSQGQRKRLALVTALLEERPFLLLDEWAADQDPEFRQWFYLELLPQLQRERRTVLAITHDDRYFHVADRVLRMDAGRLMAENRSLSPTTLGDRGRLGVAGGAPS